MCKVICFLGICAMLASIPASNGNQVYLNDGYLGDGTHYEVYQIEADAYFFQSINEFVSIKIYYDGMVEPPETYEYSVYKGGVLYKGTLNLTSAKYSSSKTVAIYSGEIYPAE